MLYLPILLSVFYWLDKNVLPSLYIFDPVKLQELSQLSIEASGGNTTVLFEDLVERLQKEYGKQHVMDLKREDWFFNNAGGAMVSVSALLFAFLGRRD